MPRRSHRQPLFFAFFSGPSGPPNSAEDGAHGPRQTAREAAAAIGRKGLYMPGRFCLQAQSAQRSGGTAFIHRGAHRNGAARLSCFSVLGLGNIRPANASAAPAERSDRGSVSYVNPSARNRAAALWRRRRPLPFPRAAPPRPLQARITAGCRTGSPRPRRSLQQCAAPPGRRSTRRPGAGRLQPPVDAGSGDRSSCPSPARWCRWAVR
jgi:hypothetical protein